MGLVILGWRGVCDGAGRVTLKRMAVLGAGTGMAVVEVVWMAAGI